MAATRRPETAERMAEIVRLRRARVPQSAIAEQLGISQQRVSQLYQRALREIPAGNVAEYRAEELDLIDAATRGLLRLAHDPVVSPRTRVEAWSVLRGWAERRAKLLGLDAPQQARVSVITEDMVDAEIARLTAEIEQQERALAGE